MKWHLEIEIPKYPFTIEYKDKIFSIGSCFAENIAEWLKARKFNVQHNPNGPLFNPISILTTLKNILDNPNNFDEKFLFNYHGHWNSFLHSTNFYAENKQDLLQQIIYVQQKTYDFLKNCQYIFITFGSAYIYEHKQLKTVVANCHKLPDFYFQKKLLTVHQIVDSYHQFFVQLFRFNPELKIILSVSPVKYLSYGIVNNTISKSVLVLAIAELCQNHENIFYFPSYELVTDDLRDYRFYKEDMAHPNELAIQYVMHKFSESMLADSAKILIKEIEKILLAQKHKISNKQSVQTKLFAQNLLQHCVNLNERYPYLDLSTEKKYFQELLSGKNLNEDGHE